MNQPQWCIGLMSGTSMDGIDAAAILTDGERVLATGPSLTAPYDPDFRERLRACLGGGAWERIAAIETELTDYHAAAILDLRARMAEPPTLIGFHGHTILHDPAHRRTWQIGDGARLAASVGIPVVWNFRAADVAAGGQGAPLVPVYHAALAADLEKPLAVLNLGGVANVTWIGADGTLLAADTGPGNALIDDWALRHTGSACDRDGALARSGRVDRARLADWMRHPFFAAPPPKSLDRQAWAGLDLNGLSPADGAATLTGFTAAAVAAIRPFLPAPPRRWLVCGGGRHNPALMAALTVALAGALAGAPVEPVERVGWDGDALEAQAFALLAKRSRRGLPLSFPGTTGVPMPMLGGRISWV